MANIPYINISIPDIAFLDKDDKFWYNYKSGSYYNYKSVVINYSISEFINNFRFLLKEAVNMGYYYPVDYSKNPFIYCGKVKVTNNPYF